MEAALIAPPYLSQMARTQRYRLLLDKELTIVLELTFPLHVMLVSNHYKGRHTTLQKFSQVQIGVILWRTGMEDHIVALGYVLNAEQYQICSSHM